MKLFFPCAGLFERGWQVPVANEFLYPEQTKLRESSALKEMRPSSLHNVPLKALTLPPAEEMVRLIQPEKVKEYVGMMKEGKPFS